MSSIYDYDIALATEQLTPPLKRKPNWLAFFGVFGFLLQRLHDSFFDRYAEGDASAAWASGGTYAYMDRVRDDDNAIYELITIAGITGLTTPPRQDPANWIKVQNIFIVARERVHYTGQKIYMEFALNRYFKVGSPSLPFTGANQSTQIWISNANNTQSNFWLSNAGVGGLVSFLSGSNNFQRYFLGNSYSYNPNTFTINVPVAVFNALGPDNATREGIIRSIADKYAQCAKTYNVITY